MQNYIEIYKYYKKQDELIQFVFIDMLKNLIKWIKSVEELKTSFSNEQYSHLLNDMKYFLDEVWVSEASWFTAYKKLDYTSNKDISELIDIKDSWSIAKLSLIRRKLYINLYKHSL